jgi:tetratricopeptide (TPR) repeat protein
VSLSPTEGSPGDVESYESGWVALHRMLREGRSLSGRERHCAFLNTGELRFADVSAVSGLDLPDDGRAAARVDWDMDGDLDLVLSSRSGPRARVLLNGQESGNDWVAFRLVGNDKNRDAIGARVTVGLADGTLRVRTLRAGEGYLAQSSKWLHFGLGRGAHIESVRVDWPGGASPLNLGALEVNRRWILREGQLTPRPWSAPTADLRLAASTPEPARATVNARIPLAARVPLPQLSFVDADGDDAGAALRVAAEAGEATLLVLWASWCEPCLAELTELAAREEELDAAGVTVVAVGADEPEQRAAAAELLTRVSWPHPGVFAGQRELEVLDTLQQALVDRRHRMPLPSSFLIDNEGRLAVVYRGPVKVDTLVADVSKLRATPEEIRRAAAPFPGRWHAPLPEADLALIEARFAERGLERAAAEYALRQMETRERTQAEILIEFGTVRARQGQLDEAAQNFQAAADLDPGLFDAWRNLGAALHQLARLPEAIAAYERALRLEPRHGETIYNLALAEFVSGERATAEQRLALLAALDPQLAVELRAQLDRLGGG